MAIRYTIMLLRKMQQRGITVEEVECTVESGVEAPAHPGRTAKVAVFPFGREQHGRLFDEKEVRVVFLQEPDGSIFVFTAVARYGRFT